MLIRVCLIYNFVLKAKIGYILLLIQSKYLMLHIWHLSLAVNKHQALTQLMKYQCCGEDPSHKTTASWSCGADCLWQVMSLHNIQYKSLTVLRKKTQPKPCLCSNRGLTDIFSIETCYINIILCWVLLADFQKAKEFILK